MKNKTVKLKAVNAKQEEFEALYREIMQDFMDFDKQVKEVNFQNKQAEDSVEFIHKLLELTEDVEDDQIKKYRIDLLNMLEQLEENEEERNESVRVYNDTLKRAEDFIELFKEDLVIDNEENTVTLGSASLLLLEYLHTVRKTLQKEEEQKQNKQ